MNHLFYFVYLYDQNIGFLFEKVEGGLLPCHFYNWSPVFVPDKEWNKDYTNYLVYFPCASEISFIVEIKISNTNKIVRFFRTEYIENFIDKTKLKNLFWKIYTKYWGAQKSMKRGNSTGSQKSAF